MVWHTVERMETNFRLDICFLVEVWFIFRVGNSFLVFLSESLVYSFLRAQERFAILKERIVFPTFKKENKSDSLFLKEKQERIALFNRATRGNRSF